VETRFHGRRAFELENARLRVSVLIGGGHVAGITLKDPPVNPLWIPPWPSVEPCDFDPGKDDEYGSGAESRLLSGIMGHNLCLDFFGPPSEQEARCGLPAHGEAGVVNWEFSETGGEELAAAADLPLARLRVERRFRLARESDAVTITETVENLTAMDRAVGWTQHVTIGPPFLASGQTLFQTTATRSKVFEGDFAPGKGRQQRGAEFDWPWCPDIEGGRLDLRRFSTEPVSAGYTAHLLDPARQQAWFTAWHSGLGALFGYVWRRSDFPWLGIWEENHCRQHRPWNGRTLARGMEFGVSPMPETRQQMMDRGTLFGERGYRWIPARGRATVEYCAFLRRARAPGEEAEVEWSADQVVVRG